MLIGHVLADEAGRVLGVDAGFSEFLATPIASLIGRTILSVTAPEDRSLTVAKIECLRLAEAPFSIKKRYVRDDGTLMLAESHVALLRDGIGPARIVATVVQLPPPPLRHVPSDLLQAARFLLESRRRRASTFGSTLFSDPAWDLLLAGYVSEAEGRILSVEALCDTLEIGASVATRWIRLLVDTGLLEVEKATRANFMTTPLRLSCEGHRRFERYMAELLDWHEASQGTSALL